MLTHLLEARGTGRSHTCRVISVLVLSVAVLGCTDTAEVETTDPAAPTTVTVAAPSVTEASSIPATAATGVAPSTSAVAEPEFASSITCSLGFRADLSDPDAERLEVTVERTEVFGGDTRDQIFGDFVFRITYSAGNPGGEEGVLITVGRADPTSGALTTAHQTLYATPFDVAGPTAAFVPQQRLEIDGQELQWSCIANSPV